jgi:CRP-like cAMP-binding protein
MPRFFFNIRNGNGFTEDEEGREFADAATAREEAVRGIRSIVGEEAKEGRIDLRGRIEVADETGRRVCDVGFGDALEVSRGEPPSETQRRRERSGGRTEVGEVFELHLGLIGELGEEDAAALHSLEYEVREVTRGEDLLRDGDHPTSAVVLLSGLLQRYQLTAGGRRQVHSFYIATDTPCLETLHIDYMDNNLGALAPSRVGIVPNAELYRVMDERPKLAALFWRETLVQAAVFREWLLRNSQMLAHGQMAHFFCEMMVRARAAGIAEGDTFRLPITQEDLADAVGMTAVHVNRTLAMLRNAGMVEFRGGIVRVLDWNKLVETAEFDPYYLHLRRGVDLPF